MPPHVSRHLLCVSDNFPPETNAPAARLAAHARAWNAAGQRVRVLTTAPNFPEGRLVPGYANRWFSRELQEAVEVLRVKSWIAPNRGLVSRALDFSSFGLTGAVAGSCLERPDVVLASTPQPFAALAGALVALRHRTPFVLEVRDLWPFAIQSLGALRWKPALAIFERLMRLLLSRADLIVALSPAYLPLLEAQGAVRERMRVIENGADRTLFAPRARDQLLAHKLGLADAFVVGYFGTHGLAHGLESVLQTARALAARREIAFLFVGSGSEKAGLEARARELGLANVHFLPARPESALPELYSLCDCALVATRRASVSSLILPAKLFPAFGMGLPVVLAAPPGAASTLIAESGAGITVPPEEPEALAAAVTCLADHPRTRAVFARAAAAAAARFDRTRQAARYLELIAAVADGRALPSEERAPFSRAA